MALRAAAVLTNPEERKELLINSLLGFDPKLEASLNFLYTCLLGGSISSGEWLLIQDTQLGEEKGVLRNYIKPINDKDGRKFFSPLTNDSLIAVRDALL